MCALCMHRDLEREQAKRKWENWKILFWQHTGKYESDVLLYTPRCLASLSRIILQPRAVAFSATHESSCQSLLSVSRVSEKLFRPLWNNKKVSFIHLGLKQKESWRRKTKPSQSKRRGKSELGSFLEGTKRTPLNCSAFCASEKMFIQCFANRRWFIIWCAHAKD